MPRQQRQFEEGGIYHVIKRGVDGRKIFLKSQDKHRFILGLEFCNSTEPTDLWTLLVGSDPTRTAKHVRLAERLVKGREKHETSLTEVLAFVLMPNHFHLILREIKEGSISQFMQKLGGYSTYFNKQYKRVGALFQSRFKAVHIKDDVQLDTVFAYVHTNPVELWEPNWKECKVKDSREAIKKLGEYWASSYHEYIGKPKFSQVVARDFFLDFYGSEMKCKRAVEDWGQYKASQAKFGPEIIE